MNGTDRPAWREAGGVASVTRALLYAVAASSALAAFLAWRRGFVPDEPGMIEALFVLLHGILYFATVIVFLRWLYLAAVNVRALGARDLIVSPGWAVGWYFVPLLNLAMPFVTMRELWKASVNPRDWQAESAPAVLAAWWTFWIAAGIAAAAAFVLEFEARGEAVAAPGVADALSMASSIFSALLLAHIVGAIQSMQARRGPGSPEALVDRFA